MHIDLRKRSEQFRQGFEKIKKGKKAAHGRFKAGDIVEFTAGYYDHIRYTSEILGFDADGDIYILWECYWSPIRDEPARNIVLV